MSERYGFVTTDFKKSITRDRVAGIMVAIDGMHNVLYSGTARIAGAYQTTSPSDLLHHVPTQFANRLNDASILAEEFRVVFVESKTTETVIYVWTCRIVNGQWQVFAIRQQLAEGRQVGT